MATRDRRGERHTVEPELARAAISASGLTQREIARRLNVAEKTVWRYANGKSHIDKWAWPSFLSLLGLPVDWSPQKANGDGGPDDTEFRADDQH